MRYRNSYGVYPTQYSNLYQNQNFASPNTRYPYNNSYVQSPYKFQAISQPYDISNIPLRPPLPQYSRSDHNINNTPSKFPLGGILPFPNKFQQFKSNQQPNVAASPMLASGNIYNSTSSIITNLPSQNTHQPLLQPLGIKQEPIPLPETPTFSPSPVSSLCDNSLKQLVNNTANTNSVNQNKQYNFNNNPLTTLDKQVRKNQPPVIKNEPIIKNEPPENSMQITKTKNGAERQGVHCLCEQADDGSFMIMCDECHIWFHGHCVGLNEEAPEY